jgi:hypothetical protein
MMARRYIGKCSGMAVSYQAVWVAVDGQTMDEEWHMKLASVLGVAVVSGVLGMLAGGASARQEGSAGVRAPAVTTADLAEKLKALPAGPRLFIGAGGEDAIRQKLAADPLLAHVAASVMKHADEVLAESVVERTMRGRRLLFVSRDFLGRMMSLGYAYRMTGEAKYADKARAEMAAVCAFSDFNPSHFLDVGEMTAGLGVGLDWFGGVMSEDEKAAVRKAIVEKGIGPSFVAEGAKEHWWVKGVNNWNQVCHGGLVLGAMAIAREEPELAAKVIARAVEGLPSAMKEYGPDGAYPEGPGYWEYGTTFNVMLLSVLKANLGTDYGLSSTTGFMESSDYFLHATGPSGNWFNYADCGSRSATSASAAAFWFARERGDAALLFNERGALARGLKAGQAPSSAWVRPFNVLMLAWAGGEAGEPADRMPKEKSFVAGGKTPVAFFRTGWDEQATWVGVKAGVTNAPHGQMDIGQFVIDAMGVRWVEDLGMQQYTGLEAAGVDLWNMKQESGRWGIYRLGQESHAIVTVDGEPLAVDGRADFTKTGEDFVVMDTTAIYGGKVEKAERGVKLVAGEKAVRVRDEVTTKQNATIRWAFATRAEVSVIQNTLLLKRDGKQMLVRASRPAGGATDVVWRVAEAMGKQEYDVPNPGVSMVWLEISAGAGVAESLEVEFVPKGDGAAH